jgi:hypothetical protein
MDYCHGAVCKMHTDASSNTNSGLAETRVLIDLGLTGLVLLRESLCDHGYQEIS